MSDLEILQALDVIASAIVQEAKAELGWNPDLANAVEKSPAKMTSSDVYEVEITVKSEMAAAYEFGSGVHRTIGTPGKYRIDPNTKRALAFHWEGHDPSIENSIPWGSDKFIGIGRDGRLLFNFVEHPGVKPRPYLKTSVYDVLQSMYMNQLINALGSTIAGNITQKLEMI